MNHRYLLNVGEDRWRHLSAVSSQAEVSVADLLRRMVDRCLQEPVLCELFPRVSGRIGVEETR